MDADGVVRDRPHSGGMIVHDVLYDGFTSVMERFEGGVHEIALLGQCHLRELLEDGLQAFTNVGLHGLHAWNEPIYMHDRSHDGRAMMA